MANYTMDDVRDKAAYFGEMMFVLDSGEEYDFHFHTVTFGDDSDAHALAENELRIEGIRDGEFLVVDVPVGSIEHIYTHREV